MCHVHGAERSGVQANLAQGLGAGGLIIRSCSYTLFLSRSHFEWRVRACSGGCGFKSSGGSDIVHTMSDATRRGVRRQNILKTNDLTHVSRATALRQ